jgi:hypothetical protein
MIKIFFHCFLIVCFTISLNAQDYSASPGKKIDSKWRIETGILITHFQQQVKPEVGDPRGERLVNEFQLGFLISGTYSVTDFFAPGLFLRADRGERAAARFDRFEDGKTVTTNQIGGVYTEFWFGPLLQFNWNMLSAEIGYALVGLRDDLGRGDIPSSTGDNTGAFSTSPLIAWLFTLGGNFPLMKNLDIIVKLEYRNRYYSKRGGNPLFDNIEHGTQSISPLIGVGFKF